MTALTPADVKAMRAATRYVVRLDGKTATLELIKVARTAAHGFGSAEQELRRSVVCTVHTTTIATFVAMYPDGAWQALTRLVRPGDELVFEARTNNNGYLKAAEIPADALEGQHVSYRGLYRDELLVHLQRPMKNGRTKTILRELVLDVTITPDNSARSIRRTEYALAR